MASSTGDIQYKVCKERDRLSHVPCFIHGLLLALRRSISLRGLGEFVVGYVRHDHKQNSRNRYKYRNSGLPVAKVDAEVSAYCKSPATSPFRIPVLITANRDDSSLRECAERRKVQIREVRGGLLYKQIFFF